MENIVPSQLKEFIAESLAYLKGRTPELERINGDIEGFLKRHVLPQLSFANVSIQSRVKGQDSLTEKIIRKHYIEQFNTARDFIDNLPDLIGLRLVCLLNSDEKRVYERIVRIFRFQDSSNPEYFSALELHNQGAYFRMKLKGRQPQRQKNELEIYRIDCQWVSGEERPINIELQIKSMVHAFWGEVEHKLFYKNHAYMVDSKFNENVMRSTHEILNAVDNQLKLLWDHLRPEFAEERALDELKDTVTRLIYTRYHNSFKGFVGSDIDLRPIYRVLVDLYFDEVSTPEEGLTVANHIIEMLYGNEIKAEYFDGDNTNLAPGASDESMTLASLLQALSNGNDMYWKALFALHRTIGSHIGTDDIFNVLAEAFVKPYGRVYDEFDEMAEDIRGIFLRGLKTGIVRAFEQYRRVDFFSNRSRIEGILRGIIRRHDTEIHAESVTELKSHEYVVKLASLMAQIEVLITLNRSVEKRILEELLDAYTSQEDWDISGFDDVRLRDFIDNADALTVSDYKSCFRSEEVQE